MGLNRFAIHSIASPAPIGTIARSSMPYLVLIVALCFLLVLITFARLLQRLSWGRLLAAAAALSAAAACVSRGAATQLAAALVGAEQVRLPVVADTSPQLHPSEQTLNSGASSTIRVKGNEHYLLMKFDLARVSTWRVTRATLHLHYARPGKLRTLGLSTIAADWQEGTGTSSQVAGGCTFLRSIWPEDYWAGPGSDFLDVALTGGNTLVRYTDLRPEPGDWFAVERAHVLVPSLI